MDRLLLTFPANAAFFIDFDGTLAALAEDPALVRVEPRAIRLLEGLWGQCGGAVAIVTGRPLATLDGMLAPLVPVTMMKLEPLWSMPRWSADEIADARAAVEILARIEGAPAPSFVQDEDAENHAGLEQLARTALRPEARDNVFCFRSPVSGVGSKTRNDVGLSLGIAYHLR